ncbi:hypothetical protein P8452_76828 [Trifolium repens]|nr:hypothetical protein P8452_76828 [Trifolium repens]
MKYDIFRFMSFEDEEEALEKMNMQKPFSSLLQTASSSIPPIPINRLVNNGSKRRITGTRRRRTISNRGGNDNDEGDSGSYDPARRSTMW